MNEIFPLLFPYHLGQKINLATGALLYNGGLSVSLPAWPSGAPYGTLCDVLNYASSINHCMLKPLESIYFQFEKTQLRAMEELKKWRFWVRE